MRPRLRTPARAPRRNGPLDHDPHHQPTPDQTGLGTGSEQGRFLLHELQALLREDGLLDSDDVVIVAARDAYPEYAAYVCQPGRSFREGLSHMGFYAGGQIQREVPRILYREDNVSFTAAEIARRRQGSAQDQRIAEVIKILLAAGPRQAGEAFQVFLLTPTTRTRKSWPTGSSTTRPQRQGGHGRGPWASATSTSTG